MPQPLLKVDELSVSFRAAPHAPQSTSSLAVNKLSFELHAGETLGIVGESGSGKSVSCMALMGLLPQGVAEIAPESRALFEGQNLLKIGEKDWYRIRGQRISMIFQDPMTSLNPYMRVGDQVAEPLVLHQGLSWAAARQAAVEELARTGIPQPEKRARCFPHEFSGGMRQRVMIAMALITRPQILIADEPTTALDVTVQKQVLDLLRTRQKELGTAILFITHDLGLIKGYADRAQVLYGGSLIESAPTAELLNKPKHAYTRALLASLPARAQKGEPLTHIPGLPPSLNEIPRGCNFKPRNTLGKPELCPTEHEPELIEICPQHWVRNCPGCLANN